MATSTGVKWVAWDEPEQRIGRYVSVQCSRGPPAIDVLPMLAARCLFGALVLTQRWLGIYYVSHTPTGMKTGEGRFDRRNIFDAKPLLQSGVLMPLFHTKVHHKCASGPRRSELTYDIRHADN